MRTTPMSLLLCHECYTWMEPRHDHCPECGRFVDVSAPDPSLEVLGERIGPLIMRLGRVHRRRTGLPEQGTLYATARGLYFVPDHLRRVTRQAGAEAPWSSLLWTVVSIVWLPAMLIVPFARSRRGRTVTATVREPVLLDPDESGQLPEILMTDPGAFFVPKDEIQQLVRRWNGWTLERRHGLPLRLAAVGDSKGLLQRMSQLAVTPAWRGLIVT